MDLDLFRCALINFENVERMVPNLKKHPHFQISMMQLKEAIAVAEKEVAKDAG